MPERTRRLVLIAIDTDRAFDASMVTMHLDEIDKLDAGQSMSIFVLPFAQTLRGAVDQNNHDLAATLVEMRDELDGSAATTCHDDDEGYAEMLR